MEKPKAKAALDIINKVEAYSEMVGVDEKDQHGPVPELSMAFSKDIAADFIVELVEAANTQQTQKFYEDRVEYYVEPERSVEILDIVTKSYEFVTEHWGEIFFVLTMLDRTGKLDRLKQNPKIKTFLDVLFDKKE